MKHSISTVMVSSGDSNIIELWLEKYPNPHTRGCYRRDSERLLKHQKAPLRHNPRAFAELCAIAHRFRSGTDLAGPDYRDGEKPIRFLISSSAPSGQPGRRVGAAELRTPPGRANCGRNVTADGKRLLASVPVNQQTGLTPFTEVLNWPALLKK